MRFIQLFLILTVPLFLIGGFAMAQDSFELNTILMRATFKLKGNGSVGTAFILGKPMQKDPYLAYYVTAVPK